jgi:AcrR family transcriptional regulator
MLKEIETLFAAQGLTPKGRKALAAVFRSGMAAIADSGAQAASLDTIAAHAGLTQAALRYYFQTKDDLLTAIFTAGTLWFRSELASIVADTDLPAARRLERCIGRHLDFMEAVDSVFWLEGSAYWIRTAPNRRVRNEFYRWMVAEYASMIGEIKPSVGRPERLSRAFAIVSLVLGSWITHGRGSAWGDGFDVRHRRSVLLRAATRLAID